MNNLISLILFVEKTLDLNQEMLDALLETSDYIVSYSKAHNIPMLAQHEKRLKSLIKEINSLSERMIIHISEFNKGVDQ